ncbi:ankyrin repeat domain-containing protein 22 isoform X2 [Latimeria chalumnae]|uniref:ankyrin repeat domain-containing protein 22 isoform X2 n=1 Tax=Latimeria chalumnae TaxID=7897 RepID=UPI0006D8DA22|nr:PREDICTED: ankyrin repeat domain-containing protein 22 isoform X2 [Latimeria chalumnae]|eukprot:XP_014353261.1 PREDICTED: ankyrin repeat domain-containing protein 22 isoform X2 [Latimeria chalumnae]
MNCWPICQAAYQSNIQEVQRLLNEDQKKLNAQDSIYGDTPLIAACRVGCIQIARYLIQEGANINIKNKKERTSLHYAVRKRFTFVDYLLIIILMPILLIGFLIMEIKEKKSATLIKTLIQAGVNVNAVDYKGNTVLHYACEMRNQRIIPFLLEANADPILKNKNLETPLDIAIRLNFLNIVATLTKRK